MGVNRKKIVFEKVALFLSPVDSSDGGFICVQKAGYGRQARCNMIKELFQGLFWWMMSICLGLLIACLHD